MKSINEQKRNKYTAESQANLTFYVLGSDGGETIDANPDYELQ